MNNYTRAVMIDIETLDTKSSAVVIQIAAVVFDYNKKGQVKIVSEFDRYLPIDTQLECGRTISADTVSWWLSDLTRSGLYTSLILGCNCAAHDGMVHDNIVLELENFVVSSDTKEVWTQGPTFDIIILESLLEPLVSKMPWKFYQVRDLRTVQNFVGHDEKSKAMKKAGNNHNALDDCHSQIKLLQYFIKKANKNG